MELSIFGSPVYGPFIWGIFRPDKTKLMLMSLLDCLHWIRLVLVSRCYSGSPQKTNDICMSCHHLRGLRLPILYTDWLASDVILVFFPFELRKPIYHDDVLLPASLPSLNAPNELPYHSNIISSKAITLRAKSASNPVSNLNFSSSFI